jgi:hypothetical protein
MTTFTISKRFGATGTLVAVMIAMPTLMQAATTGGEAQRLWEKTAIDAKEVASQTDLLVSLGRDDISWETQGAQLEAIKDTLNDLGAKIARLEDLRDAMEPTQQTQTDRAAILIRRMAENATGTIGFVNGNQEGLWLPDYLNRTAELSNLAGQLVRAFDDYSEFARRRGEE